MKLWRAFTELFNVLPLAALIDNKIFCVHGGISPEMEDIGDILKIERPQQVPEEVRATNEMKMWFCVEIMSLLIDWRVGVSLTPLICGSRHDSIVGTRC